MVLERSSKYQKPRKIRFKQHIKGKNETPVPNHLDRQFDKHQPLEALVTDLTYIRVKQRWTYVCFIIDLYNREIIGFSVGWHRTAELVKEAMQSVPYSLTKVYLFHSDRGKEFDNQLIDRSLSQAGCPYENAVAESTYHSFKIQFINQESFHSLEELTLKTKDYVHWWNHHRIYGSLNYQTPMDWRVST